MKLLALLLVAFAAVSCTAETVEEVKKEAEAVLATCQRQTGISSQAVMALRNGDFLNQPADLTSKQFINCYLEGLGFLNNGNAQVNVIMEKLGAVVGPQKTIDTLQKCSSVTGADQLDKTFNTYTCFYKNGAVILD